MSFGPQVVMPGAFHFEAPNGTPMSGVHPGMFQPPISSSPSSSVYLGKSTGTLYSDTMTPGQNTKRKRRGYGEYSSMNEARSDYDGAHEKNDTNRYVGEGGRRYILAGHMESPNGVAPTDINDTMEDSRPHAEIESPTNYTTLAQASPSQPQQPNGWGSFALNKIGGVVGKVFDFCTVGVFRGFYAGGGKGFDMQTSPEKPSTLSGQVWCNEHDLPTLPTLDPTGTPGRETPESTPPPAAKRRHINEGAAGDEGLGRNWVMVQDQPEDARPQSRASRAPTNFNHQQQALPSVIRRRIGRPVGRLSTPSFGRRASCRISHAGSVSLTNWEPASFASPRAQSPAPAFTPSRIPVPSRPQTPCAMSPARLSQKPSLIPTPSTQPSPPASRMRRRDSAQEFGDNSPRLDAEAKNLAARRLQEEMETDWKMNDLNAKLRDMIRQGKEALGTTIEIDGDGDVGGLDPWESEQPEPKRNKKTMGQRFSRRKNKHRHHRHHHRPGRYVVIEQPWVRLDPASSSYTYSPIFTYGHVSHVVVTEIEDPDEEPYYARLVLAP
ncbi:hypothetical protein F5B19DRAFT_485140 [Rostrohypoxylon terebratum]|nr:hypothetical protein F5B19DRAFT_485140 [Rostrohypoxylon terebratum]